MRQQATTRFEYHVSTLEQAEQYKQVGVGTRACSLESVRSNAGHRTILLTSFRRQGRVDGQANNVGPLCIYVYLAYGLLKTLCFSRERSPKASGSKASITPVAANPFSSSTSTGSIRPLVTSTIPRRPTTSQSAEKSPRKNSHPLELPTPDAPIPSSTQSLSDSMPPSTMEPSSSSNPTSSRVRVNGRSAQSPEEVQRGREKRRRAIQEAMNDMAGPSTPKRPREEDMPWNMPLDYPM